MASADSGRADGDGGGRSRTRSPNSRARALPGVLALLEHVQSRGAILGVATGNVERSRWLKLEACGLREFFSFGGFSDDCERRAEVFRLASAKAKEFAGSMRNVCVVGDTPADILLPMRTAWTVIAVATGIFCYDDLVACRARSVRYFFGRFTSRIRLDAIHPWVGLSDPCGS